MRPPQNNAPDKTPDDAAAAFVSPPPPKEYLTMTAERMQTIKIPSSGQQAKKAKPMFKHTCTRCGKEWDMPIQLDPTRPMYCAECMPIVKEERNSKPKAPPLRPSPDPSRAVPTSPVAPRPLPNHPRIVSDTPGSTVRVPEAPKPAPSSLIDEIARDRGVPVETRKVMLGAADDREKKKKRKRKRNKGGGGIEGRSPDLGSRISNPESGISDNVPRSTPHAMPTGRQVPRPSLTPTPTPTATVFRSVKP